MKDEILSRAMRVDDRRAAAAFSDPLRRRLLLQLIGREQSVAELAGATGMELKRLHYHVTALAGLGLIRVTAQRARAGRAAKLYRAAADAFYVPAALGGTSGPHEAMAVALTESLAAVRRRSGAGMVYYLEHGAPRMRAISIAQAERAATAELWKVLRLSRAEAQRLAEELAQCLYRYSHSRERGARAYLVHIALAPGPAAERAGQVV